MSNSHFTQNLMLLSEVVTSHGIRASVSKGLGTSSSSLAT